MSDTNFDSLKDICRDAIDFLAANEQVKNQVAEYLAKKLEENKVTIMPYNIGDKLYRACSWLDKPDELTVSMITQKKDGTFKIRMTSSLYKSVQDFSLEDLKDPRYDIYETELEAQEAWERARKLRIENLKKKL